MVVVLSPQSVGLTQASPLKFIAFPLHVQVYSNDDLAIAPSIASHSYYVIHLSNVGDVNFASPEQLLQFVAFPYDTYPLKHF